MKAEELLAKAFRAAASAKILLDNQDFEGACNRAYYAMFDAARAALLASGAPVETNIARTHGGLIAAFSLHLVKPGRFPIELGKALNKAEELRLIADYKGVIIEPENAAWVVTQANAFTKAVQETFLPGNLR